MDRPEVGGTRGVALGARAVLIGLRHFFSGPDFALLPHRTGKLVYDGLNAGDGRWDSAKTRGLNALDAGIQGHQEKVGGRPIAYAKTDVPFSTRASSSEVSCTEREGRASRGMRPVFQILVSSSNPSRNIFVSQGFSSSPALGATARTHDFYFAREYQVTTPSIRHKRSIHCTNSDEASKCNCIYRKSYNVNRRLPPQVRVSAASAGLPETSIIKTP